MGKSKRTEQLEQELKDINNKLTDLRDAQEKVGKCKTRVKSTYNNADSDHVDGDKYNTMYSEDQEIIKGSSKSLGDKKTEVLEELGRAVTYLTNLRQSKTIELGVSRRQDSIKDAIDAAAKFFTGN